MMTMYTALLGDDGQLRSSRIAVAKLPSVVAKHSYRGSSAGQGEGGGGEAGGGNGGEGASNA